MHELIDKGHIEYADTAASNKDGVLTVTVSIKHDLPAEQAHELRRVLERQLLHRVEIWAES